MHEALVAVAALVVAAGVVFAVVAITTGRIIPGPESGRAKILRPRLWGYGTLAVAIGIGMFIFLGPLQGPTGHYARYALIGMVVNFLGLYVQRLATKPGRPDGTATKTAS
ncbi:hypothetical protein ACIBU0_10080 [Streptomyces sp. NPDC049627]|uniref:hypothetical protein n=1 Tax=Streptomyces sp. NPDC049627 TaxID=3365595 RepID=UPI0037A7AD45